jgi:predicted SAM-dependent methyltransferase
MIDRVVDPASRPALLNLGCGAAGHPAFVNVDIVPAPGVIEHDVRSGIPFPDATYDLVYHSTMLSGLRPTEALALTRECHRVLKPGGVLRIVTEDLEQMCRVYLQKLEAAYQGDPQSAHDHQWMLLELFDQATRERHGGEMVRYLKQDPLPNEDFIYARTGEQGRRIVAAVRSSPQVTLGASRGSQGRLLGPLRARARRLVLSMLLGPAGLKSLEVGSFRLFSGQVTYRHYDRYSLRQLFLGAGFSNVVPRTARESGYRLWEGVNLDLSKSGGVAKPHTFILEGIRQP